MSNGSLLDRLHRAPRVIDAGAAVRGWEGLTEAAPETAAMLRRNPTAAALLDGAFAAAPYLARASRRRAEQLAALFTAAPEASLERLIGAARKAGAAEASEQDLKQTLRLAKLDLHLLTAFADLGGAWSLREVTEALTRFADAAVVAALDALLRLEVARGQMAEASTRGFVALAMGKQGAFELNYSSDIDLILLFDRDELAVAPGRDPQGVATRLAQGVARILQEVTGDGYVFRVDLRLRPDPGATPPAISVAAALRYYESLGQTWERAALIKARPCAGDLPLGQGFLKDVSPFIWRRSLDFAAIEDLRSMKRQIQAHADAEGKVAPGAEIKRGYGGIREIEFFVQGQQLLLAGRDPRLRGRGTVAVLRDLVTLGHVEQDVADALTDDYRAHRELEHRLQVIEDHQTHRVPVDDAKRARVAALVGAASLADFDRNLEARLERVRGYVDELFQDEQSEASSELIIGVVGDSDGSLDRLRERGFKEPERVVEAVRGWRAGRVPATRSPRARGLLDRVLPFVLDAAGATDAPDATFIRFAEFFERLPAGVQTLSLFASEPKMLRAVLDVLSLAPKLGLELARKPELLDIMLGRDFGRPVAQTTAVDAERIVKAIAAEPDYERALNAARREVREARFRIGTQALMGVIAAADAGEANAVLADAVIGAMVDVARAEVGRRHGTIDAGYAVLGFGKLGGRELSASSDLDIVTVYLPSKDGVLSGGSRSISVDTYFTRVTQRLTTALSAATEEGELYEVDMQLRPSGKAGPIAVRLSAFETYYAKEAWTWEMMALTRARIIMADSDIDAALRRAIFDILTRKRDPGAVFADVGAMRARMAVERPAGGEWDMKLSPGGFVDIEFTAQALQIAHAGQAPDILAPTTRDAIARLARASLLTPEEAAVLTEALTLQLDLTQVLSVAVEGVLDPVAAPQRLKERLVKVGEAEDFGALEAKLRRLRAAARDVFERRILAPAR